MMPTLTTRPMTATLVIPPAPVAPIQPELTFSDDQYGSSTYNKWFERHTGLSLDEALTLGLATRDHSTKWKATRVPDGLWYLSHRSVL
jgi:hypothetical protein